MTSPLECTRSEEALKHAYRQVPLHPRDAVEETVLRGYEATVRFALGAAALLCSGRCSRVGGEGVQVRACLLAGKWG